MRSCSAVTILRQSQSSPCRMHPSIHIRIWNESMPPSNLKRKIMWESLPERMWKNLMHLMHHILLPRFRYMRTECCMRSTPVSLIFSGIRVILNTCLFISFLVPRPRNRDVNKVLYYVLYSSYNTSCTLLCSRLVMTKIWRSDVWANSQ